VENGMASLTPAVEYDHQLENVQGWGCSHLVPVHRVQTHPVVPVDWHERKESS
jgi:hypothetical protein